jgi:WD40 repeat protein
MAICSCPDYSLRFWNIENKLCDIVLHGHTGNIFDMILIGDNDQFLLTSSADKTIGVWSVFESMLLT